MAGTKEGYQYLLFDVDDTLLDFEANESESLHKLFESHGYPLTDAVHRAYHEINKRFWADYEDGKAVMDDMLNKRFEMTMAQFGVTVDGAAWEKQYQAFLSGGIHLVDGALEVCRQLKKSHRLFIITNGVRETQRKRLKASGLYGLFEAIFDSQSIGFQKPSKAFFDQVTKRIDGFDKREALVIGDSLKTDIKGGAAAGIDTCWLNRRMQPRDPDISSTYTITKLTELYVLSAVDAREEDV